MSRTAGFFDQWYAEMDRSASRDQIVRRALGLPPGMDDVAGKPAWREAERDLYESSIPADAAGDPAIESLQEQARRGLDLFDSTRRVCATATAPG
jgi:hypothetical protein